jgi:hypothetical protein
MGIKGRNTVNLGSRESKSRSDEFYCFSGEIVIFLLDSLENGNEKVRISLESIENFANAFKRVLLSGLVRRTTRADMHWT